MTAPAYTPEQLRLHRLAIAATYFAQGIGFLTMTTRLPQVDEIFHLGELKISGLLLMVVLLAGVASVISEKMAAKTGSALPLRVGLFLQVIALGGVGVAAKTESFPLFVAALIFYGLGLGFVDAGGNMQGVRCEHLIGRTIMPTFHGAWTIGGVVGSLITLGTPNLDLALGAGLMAIAPLLIAFVPLLPGSGLVAPIEAKDNVPWKRIMLAGLGLVVFYIVDSVATAWGSKYLTTVFDVDTHQAALGAFAYLVFTLIARMSGDRLTARLGAPRLIRIGTAIAMVALAMIAGTPDHPLNLGIITLPTGGLVVIGFALLGTGIAVVAPLSFSAAAAIAREGQTDPVVIQARTDAVIARFNQFNYGGSLLGAVMTGVVGQDNLRIGFIVPLVLIVAMFPLAKAFATNTDTRQTAKN